MRRQRTPPEALQHGSHSRSELLGRGVTDHDLRGPRWRQANRGLWSWVPDEPVTDRPLQRILEAAPLARHGALGGWAAAYWQGYSELDGHGPDGVQRDVPVCLPRDVQCRRRRGVRVIRSDLLAEEVVEAGGLRVTSLVRTFADLARFAPSLPEAVAALDVLIRDGDSPLSAVLGWFAERPHHRGGPQARCAIALARAGSESVPESLLRMLWVLDAALPSPMVNPWLYTAEGVLLGRADLFDPDAGVVGEYDGGHHAGARQRSSDHRRRETFQHAGLIVLQHTMTDLTEGRRAAVARLRSAHARGRARDPSADGWVVGGPPVWYRPPIRRP